MTPSDPDTGPKSPAPDDLVDALLREHARLGNLDDEGLLASIRARTVARPLATVEFAAPRLRPRATSRRDWLQIAAIVALSLTVLGLFLSQRAVAPQSRASQTHRLVSLAPETVTATVQTDLPAPAGQIAPLPASATDLPLSLAVVSVSAQSQSHPAPGRLLYEGDVVLHHPDFILTADRIELTAAGDEADAPVNAFVAHGEGIRVEKRTTAGLLEVAHATQATYDPAGGRLILAGGPTLTAGNSFVQPRSADGIIVLRANGFEVIEGQIP